MSLPHERALLAGRIRLVALDVNQLVEAAERLKHLDTVDKLLDVNMKLLQVRLDLLETLTYPGPSASRRPRCEFEGQDELPF